MQAVMAFVGGSVPIYYGVKNGYIIGACGLFFAYFCTFWYVKISDLRQSSALMLRQADDGP